jgi:hypothetical protein
MRSFCATLYKRVPPYLLFNTSVRFIGLRGIKTKRVSQSKEVWEALV